SCCLDATATPRFCALSLHDALPICDAVVPVVGGDFAPVVALVMGGIVDEHARGSVARAKAGNGVLISGGVGDIGRGEEHGLAGKIGRAQSELQSRENLVCRLLLEKK